ncbi:DMT family transporter, partial [Treponema sp. R80B11-R83G3]
IYAIITIIFWSLAYVFTRLALRYFSPLSLGFLRYLIASLFLIIFAFFVKIKIPDKSDIKWFIIAGFFGFFFYIIVFNKGSVTVSASTASLVIALTPIITTLLARIFFKEKLKIVYYIAIIIEFIGVGVMTLMDGIFSINIGLIWLILASISISFYNILQRKMTKKYSPIQASIISIWFGTILLFVFLPSSIVEIKNVPIIQIFYLIILGIFSTAIAYISWTYAFSKSKNTSSVTNYMFLTPFLTTILGIILAKEIPNRSTIIGGTIIMVGMFIYNFYEKIIQIINKTWWKYVNR